MTPRILFLDSGIGGLSIYQEVEKLLPHCQYFYCLDNQAFPYSEKSEQVIIERVLKICQTIYQQQSLDLIVIACNTASTIVLPHLRQHFTTIPIVGTIPAIKPAAQISESKHIALLATKGTVTRPCVLTLIQQFAQHCQVEKIGTTLLVEMAEKKLQGENVNREALAHHLAPLKNMPTLDTIILGCTHFPFLETELRSLLPQVKYYLHPGKAIAKHIQSLLKTLSIPTEKSKKQLFATAPLTTNKQQIFSQLGFSNGKVLKI